jgi:benzil reductase ((S)-benzoin forming)
VDLSRLEATEEKVRELFQHLAKQSFEKIIFINNAARIQPILRVDFQNSSQIQQSLRVNVTAPVVLMKLFIQHFRNSKVVKQLVNISSGAALKGYEGWSLYCLAKAGLENWILSLVKEETLVEFPFQAINFDPGVMDTQMQAEIRKSDSSQFAQKERFIELHNSGSLNSPEKVATKLLGLLDSGLEADKIRYSVKDY